MRLRKGDRVVHPALPEWGVGEIAEHVCGPMAHVVFPAAGRRTVERLGLVRATPPPARPFAPAAPALPWVEAFLERYPGGFADREYALGERQRLLDGARRAAVFLAPAALAGALAAGRHAAICAAASDIAGQSGLVPDDGAAVLRDLDDRDARRVGRALRELLHGAAPYPERFDAFATCLDEVGAGSWELATVLPMLAFPDTHLVIEPRPVTSVAAALAFDLLWRPEPNWDTYGRALSFGHFLQDTLAPLGPIDFLDLAALLHRA